MVVIIARFKPARPAFRWRTQSRWRPQFHLSTILWCVLVISLLLGWLRDHHQMNAKVIALRNPGQAQASWATKQLIGAPNTLRAGDIPTAWASAAPDNQKEWLILDYRYRISPKSINIHETFNPGAVYKVSVFDRFNREKVVWSGADPTPPSAKMGVSTIPINVTYKIRRIKIYLDSPAVPGWNEIDAVGILDTAGRTHWAVKAQASSTYANRTGFGNWATWPSVFSR